MTIKCWADFETTSHCNLLTQGLQHYLEDYTTEVLCLGYALGDNEPQCWYSEDGTPFPQEIIDHLNAGGKFVFHNAQFDLGVWNYILANDFDYVPALPIEQVECSAARASVNGLPAKLDHLCRAIALPIQKQTEGMRLINTYSTGGRIAWLDDDKQLMTDYCNMDVRTMRMACSVLRELTDSEWAEWARNHYINQRGIPVDVDFATAALSYATDIKADVDGQIQELTGGAVATARARKTRDEWVFDRITDDQKKLLAVYKDDKVSYSFDEEHRNYLLAADNVDPDVEDLLQLINDAGGSSTSKYHVMVNQNVEGRVHYGLTWHRAGTGRWGSLGLQIHNMPRRVFDDPQPLIQDVLDDYEIATPATTLSRLLRASITSSEGVTFGDWSAIEGRVCPWLSDDPRAEKVLSVFRNDEDLYIATATGMGIRDKVGEVDRQGGKVASLSMQFAGGARALQRMAKNYGIVYTSDEAEELKTLWREANPWATTFWYGLKDAAVQAVKNPNVPYSCGRITFQYDGADWLWMRRPSGNLQGYFQPRFEEVEYPWGDVGVDLTALAGNSQPKAGKKWPRHTLTHGILIQNATQGTAADLLRECIMAAPKELPIILHCHDELVAEGDCVGAIHELMHHVPDWATGLPLKAEVKHAKRYGK